CLASGACRPTLGDTTTEPRGSDIRSQEACPMTPSTQPSQDLPHGGEDALAEIAAVTETLTRRQRLLLVTTTSAIAAHGYPPSMREIGDTVGLISSASVSHQLQALERSGFLRRAPKRLRAREVVLPGEDDSPEP